MQYETVLGLRKERTVDEVRRYVYEDPFFIKYPKQDALFLQKTISMGRWRRVCGTIPWGKLTRPVAGKAVSKLRMCHLDQAAKTKSPARRYPRPGRHNGSIPNLHG